MKTYLFSYMHQGAECVFEICADSADDARKRVARLQYATLDGELMAKIPTTQTASGILGRVLNIFIALQGKR